MNLMPVLLAGAGGALGAVLRNLVTGIYPVYGDIYVGTLLVNFTGSTILSIITFGPNPLPYFADAGILGGFRCSAVINASKTIAKLNNEKTIQQKGFFLYIVGITAAQVARRALAVCWQIITEMKSTP